MIVQILNISEKSLFSRISKRYNVFRDLFYSDSKAIEIRSVNLTQANAIKNIILAKNEICYQEVVDDEKLNLLIIGNFQSLIEIGREIKAKEDENLGLAISNCIKNYINYDSCKLEINNTEFLFNKPYIMGIINCTPDSFSDGGENLDLDKSFYTAKRMINSGVDILDIGGESTRPGSDKISVDEEIERVIPLIKKISNEFPETIISCDTSKARVAEEAINSGAEIINDISGLTFDENMAKVISQNNKTAILMHIKGTPQNMQIDPFYVDPINDIYEDLALKIDFAKNSGIQNIIIDPGIGFGKRVKDNYEIINRLDEFKGLGEPILIGVSRKSFIGKSLELDIKDRDEATLVAETMSVMKGARIIRTHNFTNCIKLKQIYTNTINSGATLNV